TAGALGFALAGPRVYGDTRVEAAFMGDGRRDLGPDDVRRALTLYRLALLAQALALAALAVAFGG
ncbi:MAG: cobalamin biosynthesis protein, partial [Siculibacillus sp.]